MLTDLRLWWNLVWHWGGWEERSGWRRCEGRTPCVVRVQSHWRPVRGAAGTGAGFPPHSEGWLSTKKNMQKIRQYFQKITKNLISIRKDKHTCKQGMSPSEKLNVPMMSSPSLYTVLKMQNFATFPRMLVILNMSEHTQKEQRSNVDFALTCSKGHNVMRFQLTWTASWSGDHQHVQCSLQRPSIPAARLLFLQERVGWGDFLVLRKGRFWHA